MRIEDERGNPGAFFQLKAMAEAESRERTRGGLKRDRDRGHHQVQEAERLVITVSPSARERRLSASKRSAAEPKYGLVRSAV